MDALVDAAVPPLRMALVRLTALLAVGLLATAVTMLVWLPVTWSLVGSVFDLTDYCLAYLILWAWPFPWPSWQPPPFTSSPVGWICPWCSLPPFAV